MLSPLICGAFSKATVVLEVLSRLGVVLFNGRGSNLTYFV